MNKINTHIYRWTLGDCTANGLSSRVDSARVYLKTERNGMVDAVGYPDNAETKAFAATIEEEDCFIVIEDECYGRRLRAIPVKDYLSGRWVMFGGNYLGTSDSRFFNNLIKIHDRIE